MRTLFLFVPCLLFARFAFCQQLTPAKTVFTPNEDIVVSYAGLNKPPGDATYIISLAGKEAAFNDINTSHYVRNFPAGTLRFYAPYREGEFVLRLLLYKDLNDRQPQVVQQVALRTKREQPPAPLKEKTNSPVATTNLPAAKTAPAPAAGCHDATPAVSGKRTAGAPSPAEAAAIIRGNFQHTYAPGHLQPKEVCVEFGVMRYLPKTTLKILDQWKTPGQAALPGWPVKVAVSIRYKAGNETKTYTRGTGKEIFTFYRDENNRWAVKTGSL